MGASTTVECASGRRRLAGVAVMAGLLALTGCETVGNVVSGQPPQSPTPSPTIPPASLAFSVEDGADDVRPDGRPIVTAANGELVSVRLVGPESAIVPGSIGTDGRWTIPAATRLAPETDYSLTATARGLDGETARKTITFTTLTPKVTATYWLSPGKQTVGVGMPVMVTFDSSVGTPAMRAEVEKRMKITTAPAQRGSWGWVDDRQLMWRPASYWKPGTKVTVDAPLVGVQTGEDKWVGQSKNTAFTVADRARISTVDIADHSMTVREDGEVVGTYAISAGKPIGEWETRSGTKIITEKQATYVMDAATLGLDEDDPDYYQTEVKHAMRVTNTGEFLHGAPWSVWAQGRRNVSHGCINLGPRDAREVFNASLIGDVVDFTGSKREMKPGDGVPVWLFSWEEWQKRSALATKAPTATASSPAATASASQAPSPVPSTPTAASASAAPATRSRATPRP